MSERKLKIAALLKELYDMAEVPVPPLVFRFTLTTYEPGTLNELMPSF